MSHNPYTPPSSHVDDFSAAPAVDADGNRDVLLACRLFWVSFAISMVGQVTELFRVIGSQAIMTVAVLIGFGIGFGIAYLVNWWVISRLKRGRNWMRILITVLAIAGLLLPLLFWDFYKTQVFPVYNKNTLVLVLSLVQFVVWLVGLGLLHTARSRKWFDAMKRASA